MEPMLVLLSALALLVGQGSASSSENKLEGSGHAQTPNHHNQRHKKHHHVHYVQKHSGPYTKLSDVQKEAISFCNDKHSWGSRESVVPCEDYYTEVLSDTIFIDKSPFKALDSFPERVGVVVHHTEGQDLAWFEDYFPSYVFNVYVYTKADYTPPAGSEANVTVLALEGLDKDANAYLQHIDTHFRQMEEVMMFVPGDAATVPMKRFHFNRLIRDLQHKKAHEQAGPAFKVMYCDNAKGIKSLDAFKISESSCDGEENNKCELTRPSRFENYGEFRLHYSGNPVHQCPRRVTFLDMFTVPEKNIRANGVVIYKELLRSIGENPEHTQYIERFWAELMHQTKGATPGSLWTS